MSSSPAPQRFRVLTDAGDVIVTVNQAAGGLDADLLELEMASGDGLEMATPLKAFAAKMVDIIEGKGLVGFVGGPRMRELMVREKATAELRRIERFASERKTHG